MKSQRIDRQDWGNRTATTNDTRYTNEKKPSRNGNTEAQREQRFGALLVGRNRQADLRSLPIGC